MISTEQITTAIENINLVGQRLKFRKFREADKAYEIKQQQDPEVMKYIREPQTEAQVEEYFSKLLAPWPAQEGLWQGFCIERNEDQQVLGGVSFRFESIDFEIVEIGYRFDPRFYGQGYATEAVKLLVKWLFEVIQVHKIVAKCDPDNHASYRIMEKLEMQKEALLRQHYKLGDKYTDELIYGLLASEYHS